MRYNFDEIIPRENTNSVKYDIRETYFGKPDVFPMWVADMDFKTPDFILEAIRERLNHEILGYTIKPDSFFESIVGWVKRRHNWDIKKEWIAYSPGVVPAINLIVEGFTSPGDKIIVQPPVYYPFFSAVKNNNRILVNNQLVNNNGKYFIDFDALRKSIDPDVKMLIFCNPHNPVGRVWTKEELTELGNICIENDILIVSDEIHSDLVFPGYTHIPIASLSPEIDKRTITCMAPSKTFNLAGLATSEVIISNPRLRHAYDKVLDKVHIGMGNALGLVALEAAYSKGDEWLDELIKYLTSNLDVARNFLKQEIPSVKLIEPEATYLLWLDFNKLNMSNEALKSFIITDAGLGFNDGPVFGSGGEGFQRMNIALPQPQLMEALDKLKSAFKRNNL